MPLSNTTIALTSAAVACSTAIAGSAMGWFSGDQMPVEGKTVLLTGASEGLGRSVARQLAEQGAHVIVVARNVGRLAETVTELRNAAKYGTQRFHHIAADVAEPNYAAAVLADALAWNGGAPIDIVWCLAGMSTPMLWVEETPATALGASRRNMDVNYWGTAEMAHAILREWLRPDAPAYTQPRHLVFTASVLAVFAVAGYAPYTPTKWALRGLADTLAQETLLYYDTHPVRIHLVLPGTILSPGFAREMQTKPAITVQLEQGDPQQTPDQVATAALRGLRRGDAVVTVAPLGTLMRWGALAGTPRNNRLLDTLGGCLTTIIMVFVIWWMHGDIRAFGRKHPPGHKE